MKIQNPLHTSSSVSSSAVSASRTLLAAAAVAVLTLAGCASGGNPNGDTTPSSTANNDPGAVPVGNVASSSGNVVTQTGKTVSDLGTTIGTASVPVIGGTAAQKERYLEPLLDNRIVSGFSMTEPQGGSDPTGFRTRAVLDGDHWVINGEKWFTTNAKWSEFLIVMAVTDPDA